MSKDFDTKEICATCGHRLGLHKSEDYSCPKDIGRAGEFLETKFTRISPTTEEAELWEQEYVNWCKGQLKNGVSVIMSKREWFDYMKDKYSISRREEHVPSWQSAFLKEPVSFLLVNALKYLNPEQLISLRNALIERTPKEEEKSEAIEFKDWCEENESILDIQAQHTHTTAELYQEFQLYKKQKQ